MIIENSVLFQVLKFIGFKIQYSGSFDECECGEIEYISLGRKLMVIR
jgi:hypothetical protein